ncbi:MAG: OadG family protein [Lachnospira sp.]
MKKTNLKKFLLLFCMLACVFSITACGNQQINADKAEENQKEYIVSTYSIYFQAWAIDMIGYLNDNYDEAGTTQIIKDAENAISLMDVNSQGYIVNQDGINVKTIELYNSWNSTKKELGKLAQELSLSDAKVEASNETGTLCTITVNAKYEKRDCTFEFTINDDDVCSLESGAINPTYTTSEKMAKAGVNTLIGMGTVFVVLIFISFIIYLLKFVNVIGNKEKNKEKEDAAAVGVDNAIAQIVSNEEQEADDLELVAVITAAIAAMEGTSADGLVVRSIRKVNDRRK